MIKVTDLSFGFPQKDLYTQVCFTIEEGNHAVLIGSNGTGKSTLIRMLMDRELYVFDGKIEVAENVRMALVNQYTSHEGSGTVFDFLAEPFVKMLAESDAAGMALGEAEDMEKAYEEYQKLLDSLDAVDAYNYETNIKKQLAVAGLEQLQDRTVDQVSGGEYKLLLMIKNMLLMPQLLILDEPDAFLDFENLVSLTKVINNYKGTLLAVTHNRLLLGQCFDKILHLENTELQEYPGTYAEYMRDSLETKVLAAEQTKKDEEWIAVQEKLVERMRARATVIASPKHGAQLKARTSYLARLQARKAKNPFLEDRNFSLQFPEMEAVNAEEEQPVVISVKDYALCYDKQLLSGVSFDIRKGEKVALVGANGTGKSSLLRDLEKSLREKGEANIAFFTQIYDKEEQLSGGEKNLKQLHEICESEAEILLLDEPTSHLDTYAQVALEDAVNAYNGTVLMVSHDFYSVANCIDRILLLEDGTLREMSGRAFRKMIYKKYFSSDIFEKEKAQKELELKVNRLLKNGKIAEAKNVLGLDAED